MDPKDVALITSLIETMDFCPSNRKFFILGNIFGFFRYKYKAENLDAVQKLLEQEVDSTTLLKFIAVCKLLEAQ